MPESIIDLDAALDDAKIIFEVEREFRTERVVWIEDDIYHVDANGGARGAWDTKCPQGRTRVTVIDRTEARRLGLEWELDLEEVAARTKEL